MKYHELNEFGTAYEPLVTNSGATPVESCGFWSVLWTLVPLLRTLVPLLWSPVTPTGMGGGTKKYCLLLGSKDTWKRTDPNGNEKPRKCLQLPQKEWALTVVIVRVTRGISQVLD